MKGEVVLLALLCLEATLKYPGARYQSEVSLILIMLIRLFSIQYFGCLALIKPVFLLKVALKSSIYLA